MNCSVATLNRVLADSLLKVQQYVLFCDSFALQNLSHCLTHLFVANHDCTCLAGIKFCSSLHQNLQVHAPLQLIKKLILQNWRPTPLLLRE